VKRALAAVLVLVLAVACGGGTGAADAVSEAACVEPCRDVAETVADAVADAEAVAETLAEAVPDTGAFEALACPSEPGTPQSLHEKAGYFDALAQSLHVRPGQDLLWCANVQDDGVTFKQVDMSDNVGMWTAVYGSSQAFRWAATHDPQALDNLKRILRGERDLQRITGVRGLFTRVMVDPSLPGFFTDAQLAAWYPDCDLSVKHCKRYLKVEEGPYAGKWFKTDVSKDEYSGHMFNMAVTWELVDDPEARGMVHEIVTAVADHLIEHDLRITDVDGKTTTFGFMNAVQFNDFAGFNAGLTLSWMRLAAAVGGEKYQAYYDNCLLQKAGENPCVAGEPPKPYTSYLDKAGLDLDCMTNWNNHNMLNLAYYGLLRHETDPGLLSTYRAAYRDHVWDADDPRPMSKQQNPLYTMFYLVNRDPADPWPVEAADQVVCVLKRFPAEKSHHPIDNMPNYSAVCEARDGDPMTDVLIPIDDTGMDNFLWTRNPYEMEVDPGDPRRIESPEDYLLAYWLGRWWGFISPQM
jgi:hypothetical protein